MTLPIKRYCGAHGFVKRYALMLGESRMPQISLSCDLDEEQYCVLRHGMFIVFLSLFYFLLVSFPEVKEVLLVGGAC